MEFSSPEVFLSFEELNKRTDCVLMGRGTFEKVISFENWPYQKKVFVMSRSLKNLPPALSEKTELISKSPRESLDYLAEKGYKTVYIDGGQLIQSFLREDLVDELIQSRVPVLIGKGIPLYGSIPDDIKFNHIRTESFPNGLVMSFYDRGRTRT